MHRTVYDYAMPVLLGYQPRLPSTHWHAAGVYWLLLSLLCALAFIDCSLVTHGEIRGMWHAVAIVVLGTVTIVSFDIGTREIYR